MKAATRPTKGRAGGQMQAESTPRRSNPFAEPAVYGTTRACDYCPEILRFRLARDGSHYLPVDADGGWHWIYCPPRPRRSQP
jgi:hypothetical protein